jgi:D-glycerate 3-kinase
MGRFDTFFSSIEADLVAYLTGEGIALSQTNLLIPVYLQIAAWITQQKQKQPENTYVLGINGAQGSGKSTLCGAVSLILTKNYRLSVAAFSLDDLYKTRNERMLLAQTIHPLLISRGVPGTHDITIGLKIIENLNLKETSHVALPVFDKSIDDRMPMHEWRYVTTPIDIVILDGWCMGALPQSNTELHNPVNVLERQEDSGGIWRSYVNTCLANEYQTLFSQLNGLIMIKVPSMACVYEWRGLQEKKLAARHKDKIDLRIMTPSQIDRFIMHYERLTRHMLGEMPDRADLILSLDENHNFIRIQTKR